jgi:3-phosphoshikimate 1-carboxyvinyltransferase
MYFIKEKMQFLVKKSKLEGIITVPPSKSHTLRSILFGALGKGKSIIHDYLPSTDSQAMIHACRLFGAAIDILSNKITIEGINGQLLHANDVINAGNSGIVLRFCAAVGALAKNPVVITGDHSICHQRPMKSLLHGLSQLGVSAVSMRGDGFAPVIIRGPMRSGKVVINGEDSQPVSAMLIASAFAEGPIEIEVENPGELPWINLTLNWLDKFKIKYVSEDSKKYHLIGGTRYDAFEYYVPGDFSSAAFPIAAALITNSEITLKNIDMNDSQGDKELILVLKKMGALFDIDPLAKTLTIRKNGNLKGMKIDINNFIDAITILAVISCYAEGETCIYNAAVAKQKECNRITCIAKELRKMGANIMETNDGLIIKKSHLKGAAVESYYDHRMAMSLAVAAMGAEGETLVSSIECVSKTFPSFLHDFSALKANIREVS